MYCVDFDFLAKPVVFEPADEIGDQHSVNRDREATQYIQADNDPDRRGVGFADQSEQERLDQRVESLLEVEQEFAELR